jgi:hypothetical protein
MNERIRLLAEQAGITTNLDTDFFEKDPNKWVDYFSEKFAQLIVEECGKVANSHMVECEGINYGIGTVIKRHFGVEE